jgi:molybdenum cofactor biosynthesis enzyme MoaA
MEQKITVYKKLSTNVPTWEAENNPFKVVIADITHKCNMECNNCYIPNREFPDMDTDLLVEFAKRLPGRVELRLIGAEPTMNEDLPNLIRRLTTETPHRVILLTNGLKFASRKYAESLRNAGLKYLYISMNGLDNDEWYQQIDGLACAKNKVKALKNAVDLGFAIDIGCILIKGINESAVSQILPMLKSAGMSSGVIRFKNVGQVGRYQLESSQNLSIEEISKLCADAWNIDLQKIESSKNLGAGNEFETRYFSVDGNLHRGLGFWCKITDWEYISSGGVSHRRGRITEDWKLAGFSEHVKANEGGY